ncbi:hypothetical protein PLICRDRAFT_50808 [Plicaturopsis crispa FD-325 SS-3]|nr:hypothetical protein PLICRDRAFT_50808 [Plicaturopsis crispa FD-325 SS-3]
MKRAAISASMRQNHPFALAFRGQAAFFNYKSVASAVPLTAVSQSNVPQQVDLLERYRGLVLLGKIKYDEEQVRVVMQLRKLQKELLNYAPPALPSHLLINSRAGAENVTDESWWSYSEQESQVASHSKAIMRIKSHAEDLAELTTPKGLFLTGPPGSGKSFLIDLWLSALPTPYKTRKHYSQLVLEIYRAVWVETQRRMTHVQLSQSPAEAQAPWNRTIRQRWRELLKTDSLPKYWTRSSASTSPYTRTTDPTIAFVVARRLLLHHWLLVFDEIQLLDVSSATLLADVLSWYWRMGGVIVGSSNKVPDDLYKNGVQRARLEPFVEALKVRCPVMSMRGEKDWREVRSGDGAASTWFKWGEENEFEERLKAISGEGPPTSGELHVFGRILRVPFLSDGVCKFTFPEICEESLGPADYLTLASNFHTVVITDIPILKLASKNQARRFISLIDALYETRCRLVCLAESAPQDLFFPDALQQGGDVPMDPIMAESVTETQDIYRPNVAAYDAPKMTEAPVAPSTALPLDTLSIFSGKDEQFAFKRALSRLLEMTSASYGQEEHWTPLPSSSRQWERTVAAASSQHPRVPGSRSPSPDVDEEDDFALEAAYHTRQPWSDRPSAPRLSENHMWGVREDWADRGERGNARLGRVANSWKKDASKGD